MTIREAIMNGNSRLKAVDIENPGLDTSLLLAHVLGISRASLIAAGSDPISKEAYSSFCDLISRRQSGECTAYITGKKEFWGLEFTVNHSVLVPRPDTEILAEASLEFLKKRNDELGMMNREQKAKSKIRVVDLCTGSGAVAIALKSEMPDLEVYATDISPEAIEVAKQNARRLLGENQINFYHGDLYNAIAPYSPLPTPYSLITSNPPYIPSAEITTLPREVQKEPHIALDGGTDGLEIIKRIIEGAANYLHSGGALLLEANPRQMEKISVLLDKYGFRSIKLYKDLSGQERVIGGILQTETANSK